MKGHTNFIWQLKFHQWNQVSFRIWKSCLQKVGWHEWDWSPRNRQTIKHIAAGKENLLHCPLKASWWSASCALLLPPSYAEWGDTKDAVISRRALPVLRVRRALFPRHLAHLERDDPRLLHLHGRGLGSLLGRGGRWVPGKGGPGRPSALKEGRHLLDVFHCGRRREAKKKYVRQTMGLKWQ